MSAVKNLALVIVCVLLFAGCSETGNRETAMEGSEDDQQGILVDNAYYCTTTPM